MCIDMDQIASLLDLKLNQSACLTIGAFDGVHRGHQQLIGELVQHAHAVDRAAVVVTFFPHPSVFLRGRRPSFYLSTPEEKAERMAALGVDALLTHTFDAAFASITATDYVQQLVAHARVNELWCGADFALGHNREGNVTFLRAAGERLGFSIRVPAPVLMDGEIISSTRIRQCLRDGAVESAAKLLGRPFRLTGRVVEGARRGRTIGVPTANLSVSEEQAVPGVGVYACRAALGPGAGDGLPAVTNIGFRPTFNSTEPKLTIETHLLDFNRDVYGQPVTLEFVSRLRAEMKFAGVEALVAQIQQDINTARGLLQVER
jgi:riboflavin kinase/FMN adenylyltransferase